MLGGLLALPVLLAGPLDSGGGPFGGGGGGATGPTGATGATGPVLDCASTVGLHSCEVHLTAAQVNTWADLSPMTLVATPGAGKLILPLHVTLEHKFGTRPFCSDGVALTMGLDLAHPPPGGSTVFWAPSSGNMFVIDTPSDAVLATHFGVTNQDGPLKSGNAYDLNSALVNKPFLVQASGNPSACGQIATSSKVSGGSGYAPGDTGTINCVSSNTDATYVVDTVSSGAVVTYHLVNKGTFYFTVFDNPCPTATGGGQPGSGTGFTVNINTIAPGDGDVYLTTDYRVIALH